jgi:hypothetical protein
MEPCASWLSQTTRNVASEQHLRKFLPQTSSGVNKQAKARITVIGPHFGEKEHSRFSVPLVCDTSLRQIHRVEQSWLTKRTMYERLIIIVVERSFLWRTRNDGFLHITQTDWKQSELHLARIQFTDQQHCRLSGLIIIKAEGANKSTDF